ncbi:MAG: glycosyltransferase [Pseudomonadota bacterium]
MKVLFIIDHDVALVNGASFKSGQFIDYLTRNGHDVSVIFPSKKRKKQFQDTTNLKHYPIPSFSIPGYKEYCVPLPPLAPGLWTRKWDVDIIHTETLNPTLLLLGTWIKKRSKVPMFNVLTANLHVYTSILFPKDNFIKRFCKHYGIKIYNAISNKIEGSFVLSEGMKKTLTQDFFQINQDRVHKLIRPMDFERFSKTAKGCDLYDIFDVPKQNRLVTLSRMCKTKNVEFLIRSFACFIWPKNKDLHFFIGGYGPIENKLKKLAEALECPNIHFLGKIDYDAVPGFLQEAGYFLYSSLSETFGNVVCEAKYSKVPVVALDDHAGVHDQIVDMKNGVLVAHDDEEEYANRFFEVYTDSICKEGLVFNAYLDVLINNNPLTIYRNLVKIYSHYIETGSIEQSMITKSFTYDREFFDKTYIPERIVQIQNEGEFEIKGSEIEENNIFTV